jgi:hypothetical protein
MRTLLLTLGLIATATTLAAKENLVILPSEITLAASTATQSLLVERIDHGANVGQVTDGVTFTSSDANVAVIEQGVLIPKGNGTATITAKTATDSATARVTVKNFEQPFVWSFRNHVESMMAKTGCTSGPCHGAQAGKGGFKLSLFGFDPEGDYFTITRQARGRRVTPSDPGRSLLLTKPTGAVPHKGGIRFDTNSREYRVLADWIAAGMPAPTATEPKIERIEILPHGVVLQPGAKQQLILLAHFSDGHVEDVTKWGRFTSTNATMATIGDQGLVTIVGHGEGAITAWYLSKLVTATVTSPYNNTLPEKLVAQAERRNFIDDHVQSKLASLRVPASPLADDSEFLRRAFLDTIGVLPTKDEAKTFLADKSPTKRDQLIEQLLDRPEFVDYWAYKWSDLLLVNSDKLKPATGGGDARNSPMWSYYSWIRNHVEANTPWDVLVRQLLTATGSTLDNGASNFFVLHKDPYDQAETTTVAFLGMSINCARCHNHPLEKWSNDQYYAFANLFARVRSKAGPIAGSDVVFVSADGDLVQPLTGKPQPPTPLDGKSLSLEAPGDRRQALAEWITSPENPYFTRSITNRVWANFFGVGLVETVDDLRLTNPESNPELMAAASRHLIDSRYDLKSLMRTILQSKTYQRSSQALPGNMEDRRFYSRYYPRRLMAEVLLDAMSQVTRAPTMFAGYPNGWRALQLPDSLVASEFLNAFGRPERVITCECERSAEPSMVQVLNISNGTVLNGKLASKDNLIDGWLKAKSPPAVIIEELYLSALARFPTPREQEAFTKLLQETPESERRLALEDMCWSLMSSKEFLFNH